MTNTGRLITILLAMSLATVAHGQGESWSVGGSIVYNDDDPDRRIDDGVSGIQLNAEWAFADRFSLEGLFVYSDISGYYREPPGPYVRGKESQLDLGAHVLAYYDREALFSPYALFGIGYQKANLNLGDKESNPTASIGAGFKWRMRSSPFSLRTEIRMRRTFDGGDRTFNDAVATIGAEYNFDGPNLFERSGTAADPTQSLWGDWHVSGSVAYFDDDPDRRLDDGLSGLQFNVGRDMTDHLTLEGHLGYHDIDGFYRRNGLWVRDSETQLDISANLLAFYDRNRPFAPYLTMGIGYLGQSVNGGGDENRPSASFGAGFKWRIGQSRFSIRNEYRARLAYEQDFNFIDFIATLGVEYNFGGARDRRDELPADTDGDGVLDMWDECPDTPPGVAVTSRGCEIKRMDRDEDNDRVFDDRDQCPGTPEGVPVDPFGCSLDSDRDGVPTDKDRCPGSLPGTLVDEFGCDNDTDKDGVPNNRDLCPDTRRGVEVDPRGCEIRDVISLPGVNFQSGSDLLLEGADRLIEEIAATLKANDYLQIEVAGHTDSRGSELDNQGLSDRRAKTVFDFLFVYGVDPNRLTWRGYGETQPIASNETADGRAINRRVELRVIKQ